MLLLIRCDFSHCFLHYDQAVIILDQHLLTYLHVDCLLCLSSFISIGPCSKTIFIGWCFAEVEMITILRSSTSKFRFCEFGEFWSLIFLSTAFEIVGRLMRFDSGKEVLVKWAVERLRHNSIYNNIPSCRINYNQFWWLLVL